MGFATASMLPAPVVCEMNEAGISKPLKRQFLCLVYIIVWLHIPTAGVGSGKVGPRDTEFRRC